jgi:hypothetical protein
LLYIHRKINERYARRRKSLRLKCSPTQRPKEQLFCFFREIGCPHPTEVHPTGGSLRVFKRFVGLGVDSVKMAVSRPAHQRVTHTVRCLTNVCAELIK